MSMYENQENLSPNIVRRVYAEFKELQKEPIDGIGIVFDQDNFSQLIATIKGPRNTFSLLKVKIC